MAISPVNGDGAVPSDAPIRVTFDRPMDEASVERRFRLVPAVPGRISWPSRRRMVFHHAPFDPAHKYEVVLDPGYRDAFGNVNPFRHTWKFKTEDAPVLTGASPANDATGVDPASYLTLNFSRGMNLASVERAVTIFPALTYTVERTPGDPAQIVIVPQGLLQARTRYAVAITRQATDVDGNHLARAVFITFQTGAAGALSRWITFTATLPGSTPELWMVDPNRLPRPLLSVPVATYSWSSDGTKLLVRAIDGSWFVQPLDGATIPLPITGQWVAFLAPGQGYVYLAGDQLGVLRADGTSTVLASGVTSAAVSPDGLRVAFATPSGSRSGWEVDAYDVQLNARYQLFSVPSSIDELTWSPDGQWLAYRLTGNSDHMQLRATSLRDGTTVTLASGRISAPAWQADSRHLFYLDTSSTRQGLVTKIFRATVEPLQLPSASTGMPAGNLSVQSFSPSPDGRQLALVAATATSAGAVWIMNADGTGLTDLVGNDFAAAAGQVAWNPG